MDFFIALSSEWLFISEKHVSENEETFFKEKKSSFDVRKCNHYYGHFH